MGKERKLSAAVKTALLTHPGNRVVRRWDPDGSLRRFRARDERGLPDVVMGVAAPGVPTRLDHGVVRFCRVALVFFARRSSVPSLIGTSRHSRNRMLGLVAELLQMRKLPPVAQRGEARCS